MSYYVVEFKEDCGGGIGIVHRNWLTPRKEEVFWPCIKQQSKFRKSLIKGEEPTDEWKLCGLKKKFYETDDLLTAYRKSKEAEDVSDLLSDIADPALSGRPQRKRKKKVVSDYNSSESEDDLHPLKRPSPVKLSFTLSGHSSQTHSVTEQLQACNRSQALLVSPLPSESLTSSLPDTNTASLPLSHRENIQILSSPEATVVPSMICDTPRSVRTCRSSSAGSPVSTTLAIATASSKFEEKVLSALASIQEQQSLITGWIRNQLRKEKHELQRLPIQLPVAMPVCSVTDFKKLDEHILDDNNFSEFCTFLTSFGGADVTRSVNGMLRNSISDSLASDFNFCGSHNKRAFRDTALKSAILRAAKKCSGEPDRSIENAMKVWLKHAPQRLAARNRKATAQP